MNEAYGGMHSTITAQCEILSHIRGQEYKAGTK